MVGDLIDEKAADECRHRRHQEDRAQHDPKPGAIDSIQNRTLTGPAARADARPQATFAGLQSATLSTPLQAEAEHDQHRAETNRLQQDSRNGGVNICAKAFAAASIIILRIHCDATA